MLSNGSVVVTVLSLLAAAIPVAAQQNFTIDINKVTASTRGQSALTCPAHRTLLTASQRGGASASKILVAPSVPTTPRPTLVMRIPSSSTASAKTVAVLASSFISRACLLCVLDSLGQTPGAIPSYPFHMLTPTHQFICEEAYKECNDANVGNANGQTNCTNSIKKKCGTLDPNKADVGGGASGTGKPSGTSTGPSSTSTSKAAAPTNFYYYGNGAAAAVGLLAYML